jgi:hypothetical protein
MSQYLVSDLKSALEGKIHDQSLNKIQGSIYDKIDEAARNILLAFDLKETKRYIPLQTAVYPDVSTYVAPDNMKGESILTIRKLELGQSSVRTRFTRSSSEEIVFGKQDYMFAVDFNNGIKTLQLNVEDTANFALLNEFDSLTANGAITVGGTASSPEIDVNTFVSTGASLRAKLALAGTSGTVIVTGMTAVDISKYNSLFAWVNLPSSNNNKSPITQIKLRFGANSTNYFELSATKAHDSNQFKPGLNLVRFDLSLRTQTGVPSLASISYLRYEFIYPTQAADMYVNIDQLTARNGAQYEIGFYSELLFKDSDTGELKDKPSKDNDVLLLEKDSVNLLLYELCEIVAQEIQGEDSLFDVKYWQSRNKETRQQYGLRYPSEAKKKKQVYYRLFKR